MLVTDISAYLYHTEFDLLNYTQMIHTYSSDQIIQTRVSQSSIHSGTHLCSLQRKAASKSEITATLVALLGVSIPKICHLSYLSC